MKVLVFAHTPPPFHGQSYMVQQLLLHVGQTGSSRQEEVVLYHVNARLSRAVDDIGLWRFGKIVLLLGYVIQGWYIRWKYAPEAFYYVPAPAKASALSRDWLVLALLGGLFPYRVYHWHAAGLGNWVADGLRSRNRFTQAGAWITRRLFWKNELSIVLTNYSRSEVEVFAPQSIRIVENGIADPCPDFAETVLPARVKRWEAREASGKETRPPFELLFLAHATRSKGLFDSIEAVALANARLKAASSPDSFRLTVAGAFVGPAEEEEFRQRIQQKDLLLADGPDGPAPAVVYAGYVGPVEKDRLLRECDALCFASFFSNEVQPVSVLEALAYGMPVVLSSWHDLPAMIPPELACVTAINDPAALAEKFPVLARERRFDAYRQAYLERYSLLSHSERMRAALLSVTERPGAS